MQFSGIQILINYVNNDFGEFKCAKSTKRTRINTQSNMLVMIFNNNQVCLNNRECIYEQFLAALPI